MPGDQDDDKSTDDAKSNDETELAEGKLPILIVNDNKTDLEKEDIHRGNDFDDFESDMSMAVKLERATPSPPDDSSQGSLGLSSYHDRKFIYHNLLTLSLCSVSHVSADQNLTTELNNATNSLLASKSTDFSIKKIINEET